MQAYDAIVIGLGGMGSAALAHLAARGCRVLGLEQFGSPHDRGSSHGRSRVIRQAYFEDPSYVPLLLRAYELWRALERQTGSSLLTIAGGLMLGRAQDAIVAGSLRSAREHGLAHELLDAGEIRRRFPQFAPEAETVALYEVNAGVVRPEAAVAAHLDRAARRGAVVRMDEKALSWRATGGGVVVETARQSYSAGKLVIAAGPWIGHLVQALALPIRLERQVQFWFDPTGDPTAFAPGRFPIWIWQGDDDGHPYGVPALDGERCVKCALHHGASAFAGAIEQLDREVQPEEIATARALVARRVPALAGRCVRAVACVYTTLPDEHFLLDWHPEHPDVLLLSPCSGHGFKFCPVVGEIAADLVVEGSTRHPIGLFNAQRFS